MKPNGRAIIKKPILILLIIIICLLAFWSGSLGCSTGQAAAMIDIPETSVAEKDTNGLIEMPDVTNKALDQAKKVLSDLGFTDVWHYSTVDGIYDRFNDWGVISQNIEPGSKVKADTYIELICEWIGPIETSAPPTTAPPETTLAIDYQPETAAVHTYVLNTNTKKIHIVGCRSVSQMKESNKAFVEGTLEEILDWYPGYTVCGNCHARY